MASDNGSGGAAMIVLVIALIAIVGIFAYFMSANGGNKSATIIQTPSVPQVSMPTPAKPSAQ